MLKMAKQLNLAKRPLRVRQVCERIRDLLDSDIVPRLVISRRYDDAVGSLTKELQRRIALRDIEARSSNNVAVMPLTRASDALGSLKHLRVNRH